MIYVLTIQDPHLMLIIDLVAISARAGYQMYLAQPWVLCTQTKAIQYNLGRWNQKMWLVSGRRQGMLTEGSAPDPKCKLFILSFLTLPQLLDCFICTKNAISIALLVARNDRKMGQVGVLDLYQVCVCVLSMGIILEFLFFFLLLFYLVLSRSQFLYLGGYCMMAAICFFVFSLFSLSLVPLPRHDQSIEIVVSVV